MRDSSLKSLATITRICASHIITACVCAAIGKEEFISKLQNENENFSMSEFFSMSRKKRKTTTETQESLTIAKGVDTQYTRHIKRL